MDGMISIKDLTNFVLFAIGVSVGVFLIIALINLNKLIKHVNQIIEENKANINTTMSVIPKAADNLNQAAVSVKSTVDKAGNMIENIEGTVSEAAATVEDTTEGLVDAVKAIINIVKTIMSLFSKD